MEVIKQITLCLLYNAVPLTALCWHTIKVKLNKNKRSVKILIIKFCSDCHCAIQICKKLNFSVAVTNRIAGHWEHTRFRLKHMLFVQRSARPEASQIGRRSTFTEETFQYVSINNSAITEIAQVSGHYVVEGNWFRCQSLTHMWFTISE